MRFEVIPNGRRTPNEGRRVGYLWTDNWNDWFKYQTLYYLTYFDDAGEKHEIGSVKIGQFAMAENQGRPDLPDAFNEFDERFFSLGQDVDYYSAVINLEPDTAAALLAALNDIASDEALYQRALQEDVTGESLLRYVNLRTIEGQFRRILNGGVDLTEYEFRYKGPTPDEEFIDPLYLEFKVTPDSRPPTNTSGH